ncbi:Alpha/Beta hydrolase protein [Thelonectria olida]|uniref:sn-1-specific diacylglycerol lipase n=1 Tax=Thelonectria olida TaxID=1576542 RepID=A0A9P8VXR4_9HYPO|nr:Alpha/Beta hydrolase protein [Thelonectria olida]
MLKKIFKHKTARSAAKHASAASDSVPTSRPDSSANSQAASAAAAELMEGLEFVFDHSNHGKEEPGDLLQLHLDRLGKEMSRYDNSSVDSDKAEPWPCTAQLLALLVTACECASSVYTPDKQPNPELSLVRFKAASITGTVKAASIWKNDATKTLFVSVRGTASAADNMVNLNNESQDTVTSFDLGLEGTPVLAHRGFLACTNVLLPWFTEEIIRQVELDDSLAHIVFTGHSAGGAVAALAFLHFACQNIAKLSSVFLSLITFGAPPITSVNVAELAKGRLGVKYVLAFVNEFDLVPRLDHTYMLSVVDLYRSRYGLPPTSLDGRPDYMRGDGRRHWELPPPDHHIVGDIVILRSNIAHGAEGQAYDSEPDGSETPSQRLDMVQVSHGEFEQLLFCDLSAHSCQVYLERLKELSLVRPGEMVGAEDVLTDLRRTMNLRF